MSNKKFLIGMLAVLIILTAIPFSSDYVNGCRISNPNFYNHKLSIFGKERINGGLLIKISGADYESGIGYLAISSNEFSDNILLDFAREKNYQLTDDFWSCVADCIQKNVADPWIVGFCYSFCFEAPNPYGCGLCAAMVGTVFGGCCLVCKDAGGCFIEGTKILMADGSYKNIEDVKEGDIIVSFNASSGKMEPAPVKSISSHPPSEIDGYIVINHKLKVTPNHPMVVNGVLKSAGDIKERDLLLTVNGLIIVQNITKVKRGSWAYDIKLDKGHPFYVADGFVVKSKEPIQMPFPIWLRILIWISSHLPW